MLLKSSNPANFSGFHLPAANGQLFCQRPCVLTGKHTHVHRQGHTDQPQHFAVILLFKVIYCKTNKKT